MIKHIKKETLTTTNWSGGTTTELYLYPESGDYKSLDFGYRLSTASVDIEESNFTSLPGINRLIMSLTGKLELSHANQYSITLQPFEVDAFKGEWDTLSKGKVVDFNLMYTDDYKASMTVKEITEEVLKVTINDTAALYAFDQSVTVGCDATTYELTQGEMLIISEMDLITIQSKVNNKIVICDIEKKV
ncbi:MAG: HutD family protein [Clostridiales bacterium]|nr:HutD family protein [Clostridiales bacterium]